MRPALLLIDLQRDYLDRSGLTPPARELIPRATQLVSSCRQAGIPVFHVRTLVHADGSNRMPHWQENDYWACVEGTLGAEPPAELAALPGEQVFSKPFFSAFDNPQLDSALAGIGVDTLILAGVYTHACVRTTALDGYSRGYRVWVAVDAVASYDVRHAELTLEYLRDRAAKCLTLEQITRRLADIGDQRSAVTAAPRREWLHRNPADWDEVLARVPIGEAKDVAQAVEQLHAYSHQWSRTLASARMTMLEHWAAGLMARKDRLLKLLMIEVGKPRMDAEAEFDYALALLLHTVKRADQEGSLTSSTGLQVRRCPAGVVALITPWNNPLAIPVGKLAPALAFGNTVLWKPALQTSRLSALVMESLAEVGMESAVRMVTGDADTGRLVAAHEGIGAVSLTGSVATGREVAAVCARNGRALQAELGGNNAVLIMADADAEQVARQLVPAIFSFSGQRCTAPRRIIVESSIGDLLESALVQAACELKLGMPDEQDTQMGPLISREQQQRMVSLVDSALSAGGRLLCGGRVPKAWRHGCWFEPTLMTDVAPHAAIVQQESFGPIAVIQRAENLEHALALCNSVAHGLVATLFSDEVSVKKRFLDEAEAGILVVNQARPPISPEAPFGGWKASGIGLPEHGQWDREFYSRPQSVYGR